LLGITHFVEILHILLDDLFSCFSGFCSHTKYSSDFGMDLLERTREKLKGMSQWFLLSLQEHAL
jgi:hypothetical protein